MSNDIIKLLGLEDTNLEILQVSDRKNLRIITLQKKLSLHYCPLCSFRMHSKGIHIRTANHPVMQDGKQILLQVRQRRWKCTNPLCNYCCNDTFTFLAPNRRNTNLADLLIVNAFRDSKLTAAQIAERYAVSDTYAITTFARFVDMPRRQLSEVISIDEVYVNINSKNKYAMVILDFITGEPIDMLPSRREDVTEPYFAGLSLKERARVKYIISDMYRPYLAYEQRYFPNAATIVDSFHVIKMINSHLHRYILDLIRAWRTDDEIRHRKLEEHFHRTIAFTPSKESYLLKHYEWLILKNNDDVKYNGKPFYNRKLHQYVTIGDIERMLFDIDSNLKPLRDLKEKYIRFNRRYGNNPKDARIKLKELIKEYENCHYYIFQTVAVSLEEHFDEIINSFIMVECHCRDDIHVKRLSNGHIESLNRIIKDMKRNGRGYCNFEHLRNRFLFSQRENAAILGVPKSKDEVCPKTGRKRGPYNKK